MGLLNGKKKVELGKKYRDSITGFVGTATGRHEFLNGCVRYTLEGGSPEKPDEIAFDEQRLEPLETIKPIEPTAKRGGDHGVSRSTGLR